MPVPKPDRISLVRNGAEQRVGVEGKIHFYLSPLLLG